jgi:hypothetical protein
MSFAGKFWLTWIMCLILGATYAFGHGSYTHDEIEWMERQNARDGTKCCNEHDVHIGQDVTWRINAQRTGYQVLVSGNWLDVPAGRMRAIDRNDPSPFGYESLLFYSTYGSTVIIWCFNPDVGG